MNRSFLRLEKIPLCVHRGSSKECDFFDDFSLHTEEFQSSHMLSVVISLANITNCVQYAVARC